VLPSLRFVSTVNGHAYLFGRNLPPALGPSSQVGFISEATPKHVSPASFGADPSAKFVSAVTGKNVTILIDSEGSAWAAGENKVGQVSLAFFASSFFLALQT